MKALKNFFSPTFTKHVEPFDAEMRRTRGHGFSYKGRDYIPHTQLPNHETAFKNLLPIQTVVVLLAVIVLGVALVFAGRATVIVLFSTLTALYFVDLLFNFFLIIRTFQKSPEIHIPKKELDALRDSDLPIYSVFCPLYKEWQVVPQFVEAMNNLDYPTDKLQIIFLLEEDDQRTIDEVKRFQLPAHFEIVVVPHSTPKTKPKAMNYGLQFVRGKYLVIYDAEDVPEPRQLKKTVAAFSNFEKTGENVVCIQAKLNFYNPHQNVLTRIFTAEYSLWFDLVLPGLQSIDAPIPLGGTSNHFETKDIKELNGWDAFNVTEDCDLGMRLSKRGFKTAIIDSTTHEEANSEHLNWYRQRSRWIKGYIQTYFVHTRQPVRFIREGARLRNFFIFQLVVGGKILSMFVNPFLWLLTICYFVFRSQLGGPIESVVLTPVLYVGVVSFVIGNFLYMYYYMIGCAKRNHDGIIVYAFLVPFYWLAMSAAAWQALYEIVVKPHYWAKTTHGLHLKTAPQLLKKLNASQS